MRIDSIQIWNKFYEWETDVIHFNSNLSLLVGVSGVGKTQILQAIHNLQDIADGESHNGFQWDIHFTSNAGKDFHWQGAFEILEDQRSQLSMLNVNESENGKNKLKPQIKSELLEFDGITLISRNEHELVFKGVKMPKLSSKQSAIFILKEEDIIQDVFESFKNIFLNDHANNKYYATYTRIPFAQIKDKYKTYQQIRNSRENLGFKILLCAELKLPVYDEIRDRFISIFPQIEDIKIEQVDISEDPTKNDGTLVVLSIKERGVQKWISEARMSSGMLRTFMHICELYLAKEGSVILLDEFENSLGTNCIDILTEDLIHENSGIQFIATSHHPYIINNIPYEFWKIVTRIGGHIVVKDATEYKLGDSKQDAFIRLTRVLESQYK